LSVRELTGRCNEPVCWCLKAHRGSGGRSRIRRDVIHQCRPQSRHGSCHFYLYAARWLGRNARDVACRPQQQLSSAELASRPLGTPLCRQSDKQNRPMSIGCLPRILGTSRGALASSYNTQHFTHPPRARL
jgi:hypothetical protein